ncbi:MAG: TetR/AcrR family transcriptional regulator [Actinomycetota bacterium]
MAVRADARRNRDALLAAGRSLLGHESTGIAFEDVAVSAGVGKGTLYRHFPTREHLVAALLQERFDALALDAAFLLGDDDPLAAVDRWLRTYDRYPVSARGLGARFGEALADPRSAVSTACVPMKEGFTALLRRAQQAGLARQDVDVPELLTVIASLPRQSRDANGSSPFLDVILRGIRT